MTQPLTDLGITPSTVAAYLNSTGWSLVQDDDVRQNWASDDPRRSRSVLMLPKDPSFDDYGDVFAQALRRLERLNDWDAHELYTHILSARSDVLYIRAAQLTSDGSIPIREAQQLLDGAVDMITAAARWTVSPRGHYGPRMSGAVKEFSDELRMGHTQRGSFVITVLTRLDATAATKPADSGTASLKAAPAALEGHTRLTAGLIAPFQRQVMTSLALGLTYAQAATQQALDSEDGTDAVDYEDAVRHGVTAQLCEALGEMTDQTGVQALDLSFAWAPAEPAAPPAVDRIVFDRPTTPVLRAMRDRLSPQKPAARNVTILGFVTRLERGQDAEEGTVTVEGYVGGQEQRAVRVPLTGTAYAEAVQAHENRRTVEARGRLVKEGRNYYLRGNATVRRITNSDGSLKD